MILLESGDFGNIVLSRWPRIKFDSTDLPRPGGALIRSISDLSESLHDMKSSMRRQLFLKSRLGSVPSSRTSHSRVPLSGFAIFDEFLKDVYGGRLRLLHKRSCSGDKSESRALVICPEEFLCRTTNYVLFSVNRLPTSHFACSTSVLSFALTILYSSWLLLLYFTSPEWSVLNGILFSSDVAVKPVLVADFSVTMYIFGPVLVKVPSGLSWIISVSNFPLTSSTTYLTWTVGLDCRSKNDITWYWPLQQSANWSAILFKKVDGSESSSTVRSRISASFGWPSTILFNCSFRNPWLGTPKKSNP